MNYQQASIRDETSNLKKYSSQLKNEIDENGIKVEERREERRMLQHQIVKSPERMKRELKDVTNTLRNEHSEITSLSQCSSNLVRNMEQLKSNEKEILLACDTIQVWHIYEIYMRYVGMGDMGYVGMGYMRYVGICEIYEGYFYHLSKYIT